MQTKIKFKPVVFNLLAPQAGLMASVEWILWVRLVYELHPAWGQCTDLVHNPKLLVGSSQRMAPHASLTSCAGFRCRPTLSTGMALCTISSHGPTCMLAQPGAQGLWDLPQSRNLLDVAALSGMALEAAAINTAFPLPNFQTQNFWMRGKSYEWVAQTCMPED